jgi:alpha-L-rhamnosidase
MRPYDLRCEYETKPLGIDTPAPRFSWKLRAPLRRGATQSARRIQVSEHPLFTSAHWDSEEAPCSRSVHVEYTGAPLKPRTRYWWRAQAWDDAGHSDGWSEPGWFETGLMGEGWAARWISAEKEPQDAVCLLLRREFSVEGSVRSARIYATARGVYRLWLNGAVVGDRLMTPGWTAYEKRLQYQAYDVTGMLRAGDNALGAMLGYGWYGGEISSHIWPAGVQPPRELLLELYIEYADGRRHIVATDGAWKATAGPVLMSDIYQGETYDARREIPHWSEPGLRKGRWRSVSVADAGDFSAVTAQEGPPVRRIGEIRPAALFRTRDGETVLDMGQNMTGFLRFTVTGEAGGRVELKHFEALDEGGNVYLANLRFARQTVQYTLKGGGPETYEPTFTFQGFRYVWIAQWPGQPRLEQFTGVVTHSDMEPTGRFSCNDELVNRLQHNILWSQKGNFLDVPTDCPQRDERLGWTGDAQAFIPTACFNYLAAPFFAKWLRDMAAEQTEAGGIPNVVPAVISGDSSAAWGDAATICPWTLYEYYEDKRLLAECYPMMKRWVEYIRAQCGDESLWNTGLHFGDWLALDAPAGSYTGATSKDLIATAFYAHSARLLAQAAAILEHEEDAQEYKKLYKRVRRAFREEFVTPNGRLACPTQTAQAIALRFDLLDKPARKRAARMLKALIDERDGRLSTGFVGAPHLCHALTESHLHEEACALAAKRDYPSWLYPVAKGATTIWEHWDGIRPDGSYWPPEMNSFNHYAYGSIGDWLYRNILGIAPDPSAPGFRRAIVHPLPCGAFTQASGSLATLYGELGVSWRLAGGRFELDLTVPENTCAKVALPGAAKRGVLESGNPLAQAAGIRDIGRWEGGVTFTAGSGIYKFAYEYRPNGVAIVI